MRNLGYTDMLILSQLDAQVEGRFMLKDISIAGTILTKYCDMRKLEIALCIGKTAVNYAEMDTTPLEYDTLDVIIIPMKDVKVDKITAMCLHETEITAMESMSNELKAELVLL